ncbi:MAG: imidazole glycerol phosphate synthase cyclase subunit [Patescibacteria group bacterium]
MPNIRIIPRLDIKGPNVVKGIHMEGLRVVGKPRELALRYCAQGADELMYMDIVASLYQRNIDFELLKSVADDIFIPITVGGGIRSINDMRQALRAGADKVAINTFAIHNPEFISDAVNTFGAQCVVISIEAKKMNEDHWEAYTDGGRERTGIDAVAWAKKAIAMGAGEIVLTSIDKEGTKKGFDLELIRAVTAFAPIPIIAHGGAGSLASMADAIKAANPDALAFASMLHYGDAAIQEVKQYLGLCHIPTRNDILDL